MTALGMGLLFGTKEHNKCNEHAAAILRFRS